MGGKGGGGRETEEQEEGRTGQQRAWHGNILPPEMTTRQSGGKLTCFPAGTGKRDASILVTTSQGDPQGSGWASPCPPRPSHCTLVVHPLPTRPRLVPDSEKRSDGHTTSLQRCAETVGSETRATLKARYQMKRKTATLAIKELIKLKNNLNKQKHYNLKPNVIVRESSL